jgi:hypothetical protein
MNYDRHDRSHSSAAQIDHHKQYEHSCVANTEKHISLQSIQK